MSCPVEASMSKDAASVPSEAVGQGVAELEVVVARPVIVGVGGRDGRCRC